MKKCWQGQKARSQTAQNHSSTSHSCQKRKELGNSRKVQLREDMWESWNCCCPSTLLCLLSSSCFLSALSYYTNIIDLIPSLFQEFWNNSELFLFRKKQSFSRRDGCGRKMKRESFWLNVRHITGPLALEEELLAGEQSEDTFYWHVCVFIVKKGEDACLW